MSLRIVAVLAAVETAASIAALIWACRQTWGNR
jgi:hypothetical protein